MFSVHRLILLIKVTRLSGVKIIAWSSVFSKTHVANCGCLVQVLNQVNQLLCDAFLCVFQVSVKI